MTGTILGTRADRVDQRKLKKCPRCGIEMKSKRPDRPQYCGSCIASDPEFCQ